MAAFAGWADHPVVYNREGFGRHAALHLTDVLGYLFSSLLLRRRIISVCEQKEGSHSSHAVNRVKYIADQGNKIGPRSAGAQPPIVGLEK